MKKLLIIMSLCLLCFISCSTMGTTPKVELIDVNGDNVAEVYLIPSFTSSIFGSGTSGYTLNVKNTSSGIIRVSWEKTSIQYGENAYTPFISGQKYLDASTPMAATTIPLNGSIEKSVFASSQAHYTSGQYGGWSTQPIPSFNSIVVVAIEHDDKTTYYTFQVTGITAETTV